MLLHAQLLILRVNGQQLAGVDRGGRFSNIIVCYDGRFLDRQ